MKYLLLSISVIMILYSGLLLVKCFQVSPSFTEYGKGFVTGSSILFILGIVLMIFSIKKIKKK